MLEWQVVVIIEYLNEFSIYWLFSLLSDCTS